MAGSGFDRFFFHNINQKRCKESHKCFNEYSIIKDKFLVVFLSLNSSSRQNVEGKNTHKTEIKKRKKFIKLTNKIMRNRDKSKLLSGRVGGHSVGCR